MPTNEYYLSLDHPRYFPAYQKPRSPISPAAMIIAVFVIIATAYVAARSLHHSYTNKTQRK